MSCAISVSGVYVIVVILVLLVPLLQGADSEIQDNVGAATTETLPKPALPSTINTSEATDSKPNSTYNHQPQQQPASSHPPSQQVFTYYQPHQQFGTPLNHLSSYSPQQYLNPSPTQTYTVPQPFSTTTTTGLRSGCPQMTAQELDDLNQDRFVTWLTNPCQYDKLSRPPTRDGPLRVMVQMHITHIEAVEHLQFKLHMLLQYKYIDDRLKYRTKSPARRIIVGEDSLREKIWMPHVIFTNAKAAKVMGLEQQDLMITISPEGVVKYTYRSAATIYCWMDLKKFPFDKQTCTVPLRSWTYNTAELVLKWDQPHAVEISEQLHLTEFELVNKKSYAKETEAALRDGAFVGYYSTLVFEFTIAREIGYYIMDYFIPSILLVTTSWVTFWLQADNAAPRVTLGASTMLAFITLASGQSKNLPKVNYIKASEIWFLGCAIFIFASMVEFAFVNIIWRRKKKVEVKKLNSKYILKSTLTPRLARKELQKSSSINNLHKSRSCSSLSDRNNIEIKNNGPEYNNYLTVHSFPSNLPAITTQSDADLLENNQDTITIEIPTAVRNNSSSRGDIIQQWTSMTPQEAATWIDKRSRVFFPCAFAIFNVVYWSFVFMI